MLGPAGFAFAETEEGLDSGDTLATGEFRRGDRRVELHVRSSLVLVQYHFGEETMAHEALVRGMRALERIPEEGQYPGFSEDPMAGFRHLRHDLERFGEVFLRGGAKAYRALKKWVDKHPKKSGFAGLGPLIGRSAIRSPATPGPLIPPGTSARLPTPTRSIGC